MTLRVCVAHFSMDCFVNLSQGNASTADRLLLDDGASQTIFVLAANPSSAPSVCTAKSCSFYMQRGCLHSLKGTAAKKN